MYNKVFQFFLHLYNLFHCDRLTTDSLFQGLDLVFRKKIDFMEKVSLTRDEFYEMVWTTPTSHLLKKYDITQHKFIELCKKFDIPRPGIGYWMKKANNKPVIRKALPTSNKAGSSIELYLKRERVETGKLKPIVNKVFSLAEIGKAHSLLEYRKGDQNFYGKIAIDIE